MTSRILAVVAACAGVAGFGTVEDVRAAQFGLYVGGQYGNSSRDLTQEPFDDFAAFIAEEFLFVPLLTDTTFDDSDTNYGFLVGYRLTPHLAVEGSYMDLGKVRYRNTSEGTFEGDPAVLITNLTSDTSGIGISALGILPINYRWEVYGRGGVLIATNDLSIYLSDGQNSARDTLSESSTDLFAGAGLSFSFAEIYQARLEFQRVFDAGDEATGEGDVDLLTFGITVTF